jgi:hypothetical protein
VTDVDVDDVAENVEQALLNLDIDDLSTRAGRKSWGYLEPDEAAGELLGEAVDPFIAQMKRLIELGFERAAIATCAGIVFGLYRCRGKGSDQLVGWLEDFPEEPACQAVATLARGTSAKRRRTWRLPVSVIDQVPEWAEMFARCSKRRALRKR